MSDFGTDVGNSALGTTTKLLQALLSLFEKVFAAVEKNFSAEHQLKKLELKKAKTNIERGKILEDIKGKKGFYNFKKLKKSGVPLEFTGIQMSKKELKEFTAVMEREGILFSALTRKNDNALAENEKRIYEVVCKAEDLERFPSIVKRMNQEKMIANIDSRIEQILSKGEENIGDQDKVDLESLRQQKEVVQRSYCEELNTEQAANITEKAVYGESKRGLTFDQALDRNTGRSLDKDSFCIVADAKDPLKYIRCHGYNDEYNGKAYIKTDYEVFRGSKKVYQTHDGRFDDRPQNYWPEEKKNMKKIGEFGDTLFKFYDYTEYQKWAEEVKDQNDRELTTLEYEGVQKDYKTIIKALEKQLDENGAYIQDGAVFNKETMKAITLSDDMTPEMKALNSETVIIGKQISNYMELEKIDAELTVAQMELATAGENTPAKTEAQVNFDRIKDKYDKAISIEKDLIEQRKNINAVQADQIRKNTLKDKSFSKDMDPSETKAVFKMTNIKETIKKRKNNNQKTTLAEDKPVVNKTISKNVKER